MATALLWSDMQLSIVVCEQLIGIHFLDRDILRQTQNSNGAVSKNVPAQKFGFLMESNGITHTDLHEEVCEFMFSEILVQPVVKSQYSVTFRTVYISHRVLYQIYWLVHGSFISIKKWNDRP